MAARIWAVAIYRQSTAPTLSFRPEISPSPANTYVAVRVARQLPSNFLRISTPCANATTFLARLRSFVCERVCQAGGITKLQLVRRGLQPIRTAVVHPVDAVSLTAAIEAAKEGLIVPVLTGAEKKIRAAAEQANIDLAAYEIVSTEHSAAAAAEAVALARAGKVTL